MARLPFDTNRVYRDWGYRGHVFPSDPYHKGVDFGKLEANSIGTPVIAAASGTVTEVGFGNAIQHTVQIDHGTDANGHTWLTRYHMLQDRGRPARNSVVNEGDVIGYIASQDGTSSGVHLHFEVHTTNSALWESSGRYGKTVDPLRYYQMIPSGEDMSFSDDDRNKLNHLYHSLTPGISGVKQDSLGWQKINNTDSRVAALWQELMLGIEGVKFDGNVASRIRAVSDNAVTILGLVRQIAAGDIVDEAEIARLVAQSLNQQARTLNDADLKALSKAVNDELRARLAA